MKVLIDTNALIKLLDPRVPVELAARLKGLLEDIDRTNGQLIIPVQVVGEYISGAGQAGQEVLAKLLGNRRIKVANFDHVTAVECAMMEKTAFSSGNKRAPLTREVSWQKVKVDRQIVAIARVLKVDQIISSDGDIPKIAKAVGLACIGVDDLPLPTWAAQVHIDEVLSSPAIPVQPSALRLRSTDSSQPPALK